MEVHERPALVDEFAARGLRLTSQRRVLRLQTLAEASVVFGEEDLKNGLRLLQRFAAGRRQPSRLAGRSLRYERVVGKDHVISAIPGVTVQLPALASGRGYAGKKVEVCHQPNGVRVSTSWRAIARRRGAFCTGL